jgi:hypothetical protein
MMARHRRIATLAAVVLGAPLGVSAADSPCGSFSFEDAAGALGLSFVHSSGAVGDKHLPETMGAGLAWLDYDGDGWQDLYLVQSGPLPPAGPAAERANVLFRNLEGRGFEPVGARGAPDTGYGQGVVAADFDGDSDVDLLVTNLGEDAFYRNDGDGAFTAATAESGLGSQGWSSSAALADGDLDGDLDLYLSRYVEYAPGDDIFCGDPETGARKYCDPSMFAGAPDAYFRNQGSGRFVEVTEESGLGGARGRGLGVIFGDLDGDLDPDLYVANDLTLNFVFANRGDGTFDDLSLISGGAVNRDGRPEAGMGVALGDVNGDAAPDVAVTNFDVETNTLYRNLGELAFLDVSGSAGFGLPSFNRLAFGIVAADLDHDADLDYYIANGHIFESPARENVSYRQPDQLLAGDGDGSFVEVVCPVLEERPTVARGLVAADFDNDGDLDLAVQENAGPVRLLRSGVGGDSWVGLRLGGGGGNSEAVGARVVLELEDRRQLRWVTAGDSYQSSSERRVHFGTGGEAPGALEVTWPDGARKRLLSPPAGRYLVVGPPVHPRTR